MSTLQQMRAGLGRTWEHVAEGWRALMEKGNQALTRFIPSRRRDNLETRDDQVLAGAARWGLLTAEVREEKDRIVVRLEAPGMEPDDFDITVEEGYLVIRGEKRVERESTEGAYHVMECAYGRFERAIPLPEEVEESGARAKYRRGVLRVELPKARTSRYRQIEVQSG